jgi:hypothetical protein
MVKHDVDDAFEWLIVIVSIVSAILSQYPEYFYTITPNPARPASLKAAIAIVPPLVVVIVVWLVGKLASRDLVQALAKVTAWLMTLDVTWTNLYSYFLGVVWSGWGIVPTNFMVNVGLSGVFLLSPMFTYFVVVPKYRAMYPGLQLLDRKWQFLAVYGITRALFLLFLLVLIYVPRG